jgi:hypothetical protein
MRDSWAGTLVPMVVESSSRDAIGGCVCNRRYDNKKRAKFTGIRHFCKNRGKYQLFYTA